MIYTYYNKKFKIQNLMKTNIRKSNYYKFYFKMHKTAYLNKEKI